MAKKSRIKTTPEAFIQAVMTAATMADAADTLGVSKQAVSKRLREYKEKGIKGLPDFTGKAVNVVEVQKIVDKFRR